METASISFLLSILPIARLAQFTLEAQSGSLTPVLGSACVLPHVRAGHNLCNEVVQCEESDKGFFSKTEL